MKIAVKITILGETISKIVEYPGTPGSQAEVIQWLMYQTDYKWADYDHASQENRLLYHLKDGVIN